VQQPTDTAPAPAVALSSRTVQMRGWWLEFESKGSPFVWRGDAVSEHAAERLARLELARDHADFDMAAARLTVCLER